MQCITLIGHEVATAICSMRVVLTLAAGRRSPDSTATAHLAQSKKIMCRQQLSPFDDLLSLFEKAVRVRLEWSESNVNEFMPTAAREHRARFASVRFV